jgi:hypothetical protein
MSNLVLISTAGHRTGGNGKRVHDTNAGNQAYLQWVVANLKAGQARRQSRCPRSARGHGGPVAAYPCGGNGGGFDRTPVLVVGGVVVVGLLTAGVGHLLGGLGGLLRLA